MRSLLYQEVPKQQHLHEVSVVRFAAACRRCADWLPVRIVLRGANAATRAHVARVCACDKTRRDEKRRRSRRLLFLLPRPRRELASVLAPTTRRAPLREMAPPRSRRRDQPRASGERRSAATMRRDVPADFFFAGDFFFANTLNY